MHETEPAQSLTFFLLQKDPHRDIVSLFPGIKHLQKISKSLVKFISALNILLNQKQKTSVKFYQAYILPIKSVLKKIKYQASHLGKLYEGVYRRFSTDLFKQSKCCRKQVLHINL